MNSKSPLLFAASVLVASAGRSNAGPAAPAAIPSSIVGSLGARATIAPPPAASGSAQHIYVADNHGLTDASIDVFAQDAYGNVAPLRTIAGRKTGLRQPNGISVDDAGNIYVADSFPRFDAPSGTQQGAVFVFGAGANGNVRPRVTITEGLNDPVGLALDRAGNIYVPNYQGSDITVYAAGTHKLIRSITYGGIGYPCGVAVDQTGKTYVVAYPCYGSGVKTASGGGAVFVFAAGANGYVTPIRTISGSNTGLTAPFGIAVNAASHVYVTNYNYSTHQPDLLVFAAGANGNIKPRRMLGGSKTQLQGPGIGLNALGTIFATNRTYSGAQSVTVYRPDAHGDEAPIREIIGPNTGLEGPVAVAVH